MGRVGNGAAEEDWPWDLNPGVAAMLGGDHVALGCSLCHAASEAGETLQGREGEKGLLLVGQDKVPCGFGLRTGDPGT